MRFPIHSLVFMSTVFMWKWSSRWNDARSVSVQIQALAFAKNDAWFLLINAFSEATVLLISSQLFRIYLFLSSLSTFFHVGRTFDFFRIICAMTNAQSSGVTVSGTFIWNCSHNTLLLLSFVSRYPTFQWSEANWNVAQRLRISSVVRSSGVRP